MLNFFETFDITTIYFIVESLIVILVCVLVIRRRARGARRDVDAVTAAVVEFFHDKGEEVSVRCTREKGGRRFVARIDLAPSKDFQHSDIVARILARHVRAVCALELVRVDWRFPAIAARRETAPEKFAPDPLKRFNDIDGYRPEQRHRLAHATAYEVTESSWEQFQETQGKRLAA